MKNIPQWPKICWRLRRDTHVDGIVLRGATMNGRMRVSAEQVITREELNYFRFTFLYWCRSEKQRIRGGINAYIGERVGT